MGMVTLFFVTGLVVPVFMACASPQEPASPPPLPPLGGDKGNPKLSSQLNQLVQAESRGEAVSFAQQQNIVLVDRKVRVVIETLPGQLEMARQAVASVGTVEASDEGLLQAIVPVSSLNSLAEEPGIKFIRLPMLPVPGAKDDNAQQLKTGE
ncbi:MAG: hypothetical protein HYX84_05900 [Chloroflexi bacterium]|nr:hypothetical protein [Chloroflexota bacterium]